MKRLGKVSPACASFSFPPLAIPCNLGGAVALHPSSIERITRCGSKRLQWLCNSAGKLLSLEAYTLPSTFEFTYVIKRIIGGGFVNNT